MKRAAIISILLAGCFLEPQNIVGSYWVDDAYDNRLTFGMSVVGLRGNKWNHSATLLGLTSYQLAEASILGVVYGKEENDALPLRDRRDWWTRNSDQKYIAMLRTRAEGETP